MWLNVVYHDPGKKSLGEMPKPTTVKATDAGVKIYKTTICRTDLHILR
jgi:alcohol dehydrogenase